MLLGLLLLGACAASDRAETGTQGVIPDGFPKAAGGQATGGCRGKNGR